MSTKWVYLFREGNRDMRDLLGGKGAGVAEMTRAGLPVPPGFTITTEACNAYFEQGEKFLETLWKQVLGALKKLEKETNRSLGSARAPLLVSVRSGAKFSMPGMMDTVLNIGLNPKTLQGLAAVTGNERFALDSYRRLIQMFGKTVKGIEGQKFERILEKFKKRTAGKLDTDLTTEHLNRIVAEYKTLYKRELGTEFPDDPRQQLSQAIEAVFRSWFGKRAVDYRNFNKIPHDLGTAVNVQMMVFGNVGMNSGTGVAFTRNPSTGEKRLYGEYLQNAQGEDVVAGIRTPKKIAQLKEDMPSIYEEFIELARMLEHHYRDMQDLEFTVERSKLWMLQTRTGKRTASAAIMIAVDMVREGIISKEEALLRVEPLQINQLLLPRFDAQAKKRGKLLAKGLNASPGAATGRAVFDADTAQALGKAGEAVILVRPETNPDDVHGMLVARGILTQRGGATSHAAVVARGLGKPCVTGCESIQISLESKSLRARGIRVKEGDSISLDGSTGEVFAGGIATIEPDFSKEKELLELLSWADDFRRLGVWANADYPRDARKARRLGAEGIGLCRTEHMFFEEERLPVVQQMILNASEAQRLLDEQRRAETELQRRPGDKQMKRAAVEAKKKTRASVAVQAYRGALAKLLPIQRRDFEGILKAMDGLPVIIRLIDPPLHEFLPGHDELLASVVELRTRIEERSVPGWKPRKGERSVRSLKKELASKATLLDAVESMREMNPMLGLRGIRLGIIYPEILKMQVRAILEAASRVSKRGGNPKPEIMIPLTGHANELKVTQAALEDVAQKVVEKVGAKVEYKFGTMIEIPRAALTADQVAEYATFFSFGTNDLTQTVYGYSRDDAEGKFLLRYVDEKILPFNPFQVLDRDGVGKLIRWAVEKGRKTRPGMEVGICGEHGGDPSSIEFCHDVGLNYVSCSPYRVPVARLAAARAALEGASRGGSKD